MYSVSSYQGSFPPNPRGRPGRSWKFGYRDFWVYKRSCTTSCSSPCKFGRRRAWCIHDEGHLMIFTVITARRFGHQIKIDACPTPSQPDQPSAVRNWTSNHRPVSCRHIHDSKPLLRHVYGASKAYEIALKELESGRLWQKTIGSSRLDSMSSAIYKHNLALNLLLSCTHR